MSEQLHQNKNIQNDDSAFDPDLYQDFDAEAGVQADLAAFNEQMDQIKAEHDVRAVGKHARAYDEAADVAAGYASMQQRAERVQRQVAAGQELQPIGKHRGKEDFVATAHWRGEKEEEPIGIGLQMAREKAAEAAKAKEAAKESSSESQEPEQTTPEPEQTSEADAQSDESATPAKKKIMDRLRRGTPEEREEARRQKENLRNAQREQARRTRVSTTIADREIAAFHARNAEQDNPESPEAPRTSEEVDAENARVARTAEVSPETPLVPAAQAQPTGEDAPGHVPEGERIAHPAPRRGGRRAAAAAAAQAAAVADQATGRAPLLGEAGVTAEAEAPDVQPTADTAGQIFLTGPDETGSYPHVPQATNARRGVPDLLIGGQPPEANAGDANRSGIDVFLRDTSEEAPAEPATEELPRMNPEQLAAEGRRRQAEPERQYGQPLSPDTIIALNSLDPIDFGTPVNRPEAAPAPATAEPTPSAPENPDHVYIPAYDSSSLVAGADPYSHMYSPDTRYTSPSAPENPDTTPVTPEVTATPEDPRDLLDAAASQLGERYAFEYQQDRNGRQRLVIVDKNALDSAGQATVANINLDRAHTNEQYLNHQLEALRKLAEKELPRRERAKLAIGRMLGRSEISSNERTNIRTQARQERRQQRREERAERKAARRSSEQKQPTPLDITNEEAVYLTERGVLSEPNEQGEQEVLSPQTFSDYMIARMAANESETSRFADRAAINSADHDGYMRRRAKMGQRRLAVGGAIGLAAIGALTGAAKMAVNDMQAAEAAPSVSASPNPGATQESPAPSPSKSGSPSAEASESANPGPSASASEKESQKPSATPSQQQPSGSTPVNPNRPNAPEPGQGGSGSTGSQERTESNPHEDLTFSADGKKVTAKLKTGGTIFEAGHDADLTDTQIMNAVQAAGITPSQAASLQPGQIVDFTQSGNGSYVVKLR